jgi:penicillin-binding protein 1A
MQMVQAYATIANGGWRLGPVVIERITDANGKLVFEAPPPAALTEANRNLPERNMFVTASLLNEVTRSGTAARAQAQLQRSDIYGKTGTTNDAVDAWFAGFQPSLATVVWMGHDIPKSLGERESGGGLALPIWLDYMATALKNVPVALPPPSPGGLVREGGDWLYTEWVGGGWVERITADLGTVISAPPAAPAAPAVEEGTDRPTVPMAERTLGAAPANPALAP